MKTIDKAIVKRCKEIEQSFLRKTTKFLWFDVEYYVLVNTDYIANDIVINCEQPIRNIIINGEKLHIIPTT
jgi:hypothetical protein